MKTKYILIAVIFLSLMSCATQTTLTVHEEPGFLMGLIHGMFSFFVFLISIVNDDIRIYAYPNTGIGYDFGFMLGVGGFSISCDKYRE